MIIYRVIVCASFVAISSANEPICQRRSGDQLLDSLPALQLSALGSGSKRTRKFPGFNITCIKSGLPLDLGPLLGFQVIDGGVGCDHVALQLQTKVGSLLALGLGGAKIYGLKTNSSGRNYNRSCKTSSQSSLLDTLSSLTQGLGISK